METQTLSVKNMVCDRCIRVVREDLDRLGYDVIAITLGEAVVTPRKEAASQDDVRMQLRADGFDLLDDKRAQLVEQVRTAVLRLVREDVTARASGLKHSEWIEREVGADYATLSGLFSSTQGMTIERFIILQRIERAKELLTYGELTVSEIAWTLGYSSTAHLSAQFRTVTGTSPTAYRTQHQHDRIALDLVGPAAQGKASR